VDADSASGGVDKVTEAKALYDKAEDALAAGAFARALELVDGSLRLRKTVRTYLLRAQAMQRLERIEEALAAVDAARQLAPEHSAVWWRRGWILWAARRYDEARPAFEKFLQLEPDGPKAASVRRLMNEPR
jgi:tetratricopeptide (TPR) repeat protein